MITAALVLVVLALVTLMFGAARAFRVHVALVEQIRSVLEGVGGPEELEAARRIADLEHAVDLLPQKWEEFKNAARRSEDRARKIVADAREELASHGFEHAGVDAQAGELRVVDGGFSAEEQLPSVPQGVEGPEAAPTDWRTLALRRKFSG